MDVIMPQLGETVVEGLVSVWHKAVGDEVRLDEPLFDLETDKVSTEIPAPVAGILKEILVPAGVTAKVGVRLAVIATAGAEDTSDRDSGQVPVEQFPSPAAPARLSPVVRRLLAEHGLSATLVRGSGRGGRIVREDVLAHVQRSGGGTGGGALSAVPERRSPIPPSMPEAPIDRIAKGVTTTDDLVVPLNRIRRATAAHMVRSVATSPHTLQAVEVDFVGVERARAAHGAAWREREGFSLTYLPFVARAVCEAIGRFPHVNASFGEDALIVHKRVHLSIAVDLDFEGLVATVIRDADQRNLRGLALEIHRLALSARSGRLKPEETSGGTYTISNSGSFGTFFSAPIINQPQCAILSTDGVRKKPVVIQGPDGSDALAIRPVGVLAQTFDHRAMDGAYSAAFLRQVKQIIETRDWVAELG
ncbi:MAG: dihydrolipoamide acetyltransferase family protein [Pigmentiphaga sp.]|uniref:dihydrolipoamide acetyltransferase family protein n=1 Tax=Pigmentiphaga sp. TaxID=1977564 RepID=UPI003B574376